MAAGDNSDGKTPLLTKDNFVDLASFHSRHETVIIRKSLDTFLSIYETERTQFDQYLKPTQKLQESSRNFLLAIRFLRNFKGHHRQLQITDPDNRAVMRKEVFGLMASVLQAVMKAKQIPADDQMLLREIYFGDKMRQSLQERELEKLKSDFQYSFPKLFIDGRTLIKGNWFTGDSSKKKAKFSSSDIEPHILEFVSKCLVNLYEDDLKETYNSTDHERAVKKLESEEKPECSVTTVNGVPRKRMKLQP